MIDYRPILKTKGISQKKLAEYLGIGRHLLNRYLSGASAMPSKHQKNIDRLVNTRRLSDGFKTIGL
jgi:transcriptional regulator with XRE-family HTH domain